MEMRDWLVVASAFFLSVGTGFALHQSLQKDDKFVEDLSLRADDENQVASTEFDENFIEMRYEDTKKAKFYFRYNDSRGIQTLQGLKHDGTIRRTTKIRSFGNKTYFLYLRYRDNPEIREDGFIELYRIEEA